MRSVNRALNDAQGTVLEHAGRLYWAGTALATLSTDGAGVATVISLPGGGSLAADAIHFYWADDTTVYRAPFPW